MSSVKRRSAKTDRFFPFRHSFFPHSFFPRKANFSAITARDPTYTRENACLAHLAAKRPAQQPLDFIHHFFWRAAMNKSEIPHGFAPDALLRVKEAAAVLACSPSTLLKLQRQKKLVPIYIGTGKRGKRYPWSSITEFVASCSTPPPNSGPGRPRSGTKEETK